MPTRDNPESPRSGPSPTATNRPEATESPDSAYATDSVVFPERRQTEISGRTHCFEGISIRSSAQAAQDNRAVVTPISRVTTAPNAS